MSSASRFSKVRIHRLPRAVRRARHRHDRRLAEWGFLKGIVETTPRIIVYLDRPLRVIWLNTAARRVEALLGTSFLNRHAYDAVPEIRPLLEPVIAEALACGGTVHAQGLALSLSRPERDFTVYLDVECIPMRDPNGEITRFLTMWSDVTARVQQEKLRLQTIETLQMAEALKEEALTVLAHELRTPLSALLGAAELLMEGGMGPMNDGQKRFLRKVLRQAHTMKYHLDDLFDVSRMNAGKLTLVPGDVDLFSLVEDVLQDLSGKATRSPVRFVNAIAPDLSPIRADEERLRQILMNLLTNAMKFTPAGGTIEVRAHEAENEVIVEVHDTGIGISSDDQARLFVRFSQLEAGKRLGGLGLGLAICKDLIEAQGGRIEVRSVLGEGSVFRFRLPKEPERNAPTL